MTMQAPQSKRFEAFGLGRDMRAFTERWTCRVGPTWSINGIELLSVVVSLMRSIVIGRTAAASTKWLGPFQLSTTTPTKCSRANGMMTMGRVDISPWIDFISLPGSSFLLLIRLFLSIIYSFVRSKFNIRPPGGELGEDLMAQKTIESVQKKEIFFSGDNRWYQSINN